MATYLDLVNKVLDESGKEQNPLDEFNWDSAEAGRRLYPRVKRLVKEAWKMLQMKRNEWDFNSGELLFVVYPKLRYDNGTRSAGPPEVGSVWVGARSGMTLTVSGIDDVSGVNTWIDGPSYGQLTFLTDGSVAPVIGETFEEVGDDGVFEYVGSGSYSLALVENGRVRTPRWDTAKARRVGEGYSSVSFIPWNQFLLGGVSYTNRSTIPYHFSQDYQGNLVFYSQALEPFTLSFMYDMAPQELVNWDDQLIGLPPEYHDWVAWEALMNLARFDKDPDLYNYAQSMATVYRQRAERNLMPLVAWESSYYDRPNTNR